MGEGSYYAYSSPFGHVKKSLFADVVTQTTVANISSGSSFLLLDCTMHEGMEGGVLAIRPQCQEAKVAIALLLPPLMHNIEGETVAFSMAIPLENVFQCFLQKKIQEEYSHRRHEVHEEIVGERVDQPTFLTKMTAIESNLSFAQEISMSNTVSVKQGQPCYAQSRFNDFEVGSELNDFRSHIVYLHNTKTNSWGTGVLISGKGHVLTCSHILKDSNASVVARSWSQSRNALWKMNVVWMASQASGVDCAILLPMEERDAGGVDKGPRLGKPIPWALSPISYEWYSKLISERAHVFAEPGCIFETDICESCPCRVIGFGMFEIPLNNRGSQPIFPMPSVTSGILAKVVVSNTVITPATDALTGVTTNSSQSQLPVKNISVGVSDFRSSSPCDISNEDAFCVPVLLRSSAAVHCGNSGGALVHPTAGFVGLVTMNVRHVAHKKTMPQINFSLPSDRMVSILEYLVTGNENSLQDFEASFTSHERQLWELDIEPLDDLRSKLEDRYKRAQALVEEVDLLQNIKGIRARL